MWEQLALAAFKNIQDERNRKNDIASNVINQKYQPWTGQRADFSSIAKNNNIGNLMAGYGAGSLQDKLEEQEGLEAVQSAKSSQAPTSSVAKSPLSKTPVPVSRAPAAMPVAEEAGSNVSSFAALLGPQYQDPAPLMLQGEVPARPVNPWLAMSRGF